MKNPVKSTVRQRKKTAITSTQRYLPIGEIRQDTVLLKNGGMRAVLEVEALNFNLKSETEQQGIISGYESFVNTLNFPVQIVVRSSRINIDPYLLQLREIADKQTNDLLKHQTLSYADFIDRLVEVADIMQKKFYVVVPLDASMRQKTLVEKFLSWISIDDTASRALERGRQFASLGHELKDRVMLVTSGLENIGLHCKRLETQKLIELYYGIYNPKTSQEQKMPKDIGVLKMDRTML